MYIYSEDLLGGRVCVCVCVCVYATVNPYAVRQRIQSSISCVYYKHKHTRTQTHILQSILMLSASALSYQIPNKYLEPDSQRRQQGAFHALRLSLCCHCSSSRRRQGDNAQSFNKLVKDVDKAGNELRLAIPKKIKKGNRDKKNASKPRQRVQQELEEEEDFFDRHSISRCRKCRKFAEELTR